MARKSQALSIVAKQEGLPEDSPERFALRTRHLRSATGQPLTSKLFQLQSERANDPLRSGT